MHYPWVTPAKYGPEHAAPPGREPARNLFVTTCRLCRMSERTETLRRAMRLSITDGIFAVQYITVTSGALLTTFLLALGADAFEIGLVATFPLLAGMLQPVGAELIRRGGGWRRPVCVTSAIVETWTSPST